MTVSHQHIFKPTFDGHGVCLTTLCGRVDNSGEEYNTADNVTCKLCLPLLSGERVNYNSKWIGWQPPKEA